MTRLALRLDWFVQLKSLSKWSKVSNIWLSKKSAYEAASYIAKQSGILKDLHADKSIESLSRWENVQELLNAAKDYTEDPDNDANTLDAFLAEISLFTDQDKENEDNDFVTLMTIHSAKGLEFPVVFVGGMEEELFPSFMAMQSRADLEEERRLFYVAVTRAEKKLFVSLAKSRYKYGSVSYNEPSRFLKEINPEYLDIRNEASVPRSPAMANKVMGRNLRPINRPKPGGGAAANFQGDDLSKLATGMSVAHAKFGEGKVVGLEGAGGDRKATVFFKAKGQKVLLLKYAKLKIMG